MTISLKVDVCICSKAGSFTVGYKEMLVPWILFALSWPFAEATISFTSVTPTYVVSTP